MSDGAIISLITVNYNGGDFLPDFFDSLFKVSRDRFEVEIIVVDNGSTDGSPEWIEARCATVRVIRNGRNNYAEAVNLGILSARGDYIVLANNDAEFDPEWLRSLYEAIRSDERIGAVQSKILLADRRTVNSVGIEEIESFYFRDVGFGEEDSGQYDEMREVDGCTGGAVMFRRQCLEEVGGFDPDFVIYFEDVDFSWRITGRLENDVLSA